MNEFKLNIEKPNPSSIYEQRINEMKDRVNSTKRMNLSVDEKAKLENASRGFESIFLNMMLKEIRKAQLVDENDEGFGSDILLDYSYMTLSDKISSTGKGIGIAAQIYKFFTGENIPEKNVIEKQGQSIDNNYSNVASNVAGIKEVVRSEIPNSSSFIDRVKRRINNYEQIIETASKTYDIDKSLIKSVITAESAGLPNAKSSAGAKGLMQLMDSTAKDLGVSNSFDPTENIMGGTKYLSQMLKRFGNDLNLALAAYNAGPGNVEKHDGVPPFKETTTYIDRVKKYLKLF